MLDYKVVVRIWRKGVEDNGLEEVKVSLVYRHRNKQTSKQIKKMATCQSGALVAQTL